MFPFSIFCPRDRTAPVQRATVNTAVRSGSIRVEARVMISARTAARDQCNEPESSDQTCRASCQPRADVHIASEPHGRVDQVSLHQSRSLQGIHYSGMSPIDFRSQLPARHGFVQAAGESRMASLAISDHSCDLRSLESRAMLLRLLSTVLLMVVVVVVVAAPLKFDR